ncbi:carboxylesterase/lipase family protein [Microbacterium sp. A84]|uniref:carboxylesterase/lipase family protein n=1 Tax=Microbacterium sp. A84 TaxID=3450715 RepID=UPI003F437443
MTDSLTRTLSNGAVRGTYEDGIRRFLGIPYAAAPFGENRFRTPQPPAHWDGIRDATSFGPTAPQRPYPGAIGELLGTVKIDGDDILTANVWAPEDAKDAPVVLWIHGGAFERGTSALGAYDGTTFARNGIIFVSINYRLGSEGFSVLDGVPRNLGLRDAAAALEWVHREIAVFGGDPAQITVMGESAGGSLVAALLAVDDSRARIRRAIIQSGPLEAQTAAKAGRVSVQMAKRMSVSADRVAFAALTPEQLLDARREQAAGASPLGGAPGFQLVLDPESLPRSPHEVLPEVNTPILIGTNTDEYRLWFTPEALTGVTRAKLLLARLAMRISARAERAYRKDWPNASAGEIFGQLATDMMLRAPATRIATARTASTYVYEFAWQSPVRDLRAAHALELAFVFDHLDDEDSNRMAGRDAPRGLATNMHEAWVKFITTGDPGWPAFDAERATRVFDTVTATLPQRRTTGLDLLP